MLKTLLKIQKLNEWVEVNSPTNERETVTEYRVYFNSLSRDSVKKLLEINGISSDYQISYFENDDPGVDLLGDGNSADELAGGFIFIDKEEKKTENVFLSPKGLQKYANDNPREFEKMELINCFGINNPVQNRGLIIQPLDQSNTNVYSLAEERFDARPFVNDMSGSSLVSTNLNAWIACTDQADSQNLIRFIAVRQLALALTNSLTLENGAVMGLIPHKAQKTCLVEDPDDDIWNSTKLFSLVNETMTWIFFEGPGVETRRALVVQELEKRIVGPVKWGSFLLEALANIFENSKIAYNLHVSERGSDALRLMSELKSGVAVDLKAIAQQISGLLTSLARDLAVAFGVVVFKLLNADSTTYIFVFAAVYLWVSAWLNHRASQLVFDTIRENEKTYRQKLYSNILPHGEYANLAGNQYEKIFSRYRETKNVVFAVYLIVVLLLFYCFVYLNLDVIEGSFLNFLKAH